MNILEQVGGVAGAIGSIISIFFGIYNYKRHEFIICREYEKFEHKEHNFNSICKDYKQHRDFWGIEFWFYETKE